jgi:hypothetical protein
MTGTTTSSSIVLPKKKVSAQTINPRRILLYGPPKVGKTTILTQLDNTLILDLEKGTRMLDALKIEINSLSELKDVGEQIKKEGKPYKRIAVDNVTKLEEWCEEAAKSMYMQTPIGKNFIGRSILELPNGGGYLYLRNAFKLWKDYIESLADEIIYIAHLKDKLIQVEGKEVSAKDIDLTGKLKSILCSDVDSVGYLKRKGGVLTVTFKADDDVICGSRCDHLRGQEFEFDWKKIYI